MITTLSRPVGLPTHALRPTGTPGRVRWLPWTALWVAMAVSGSLIALSYSWSAQNADDRGHYHLFWLALAVFVLPCVVVLSSSAVSETLRSAWLLAYGLLSYVPKLLRDPIEPLFHDEIAHVRQSTDLAVTGEMFQQNFIIGIISRFPGLHVLCATISESTGLSVWHTALALMALAHVLALFSAALIGEALIGTWRAGAVTALVYSLNSSFMFFDTEFAYESLAMPLFLGCLACLAKAHQAVREGRAGTPQRERHGSRGQRMSEIPGVWPWTAAAIALGAATAPVHHLTSIILNLLLAAVTAVTVTAASRRHAPAAAARASAVTIAAVGTTTALWLLVVAPHTFDYLSPYLGGSLGQLAGFFNHREGTRTLFNASTSPWYEHAAAFSVPIIAGLLMLVAIAQWRRQPLTVRAAMPVRRTLGMFGMLYFASVPFILVEFGAEGARRTWGFTYIGLAVALAPVLIGAREWIGRSGGTRRAVASAAALLLVCGALVGNVAAGVNESYRFPGPFVFGSDARSFSPELVAMSRWFKDNLGSDVPVVTDRYTGLGLVRDADAHPASPGVTFATYQLYFDAGPPSPYLIYELESSGYTHLVIDKRMAYQRPEVGVFFEPDEPFKSESANPVTPGKLARYRQLPWTTAVYESDSYVIYRFDFAAYHRQSGS